MPISVYWYKDKSSIKSLCMTIFLCQDYSFLLCNHTSSDKTRIVYWHQYIEENKILEQNQMPNIVYVLCAILFGMRCAFADSVSKHTLHVWQGRRVFRLLRVQSGSKITEDGEARRNILENTFEAALLRVDSAVHLRYDSGNREPCF